MAELTPSYYNTDHVYKGDGVYNEISDNLISIIMKGFQLDRENGVQGLSPEYKAQASPFKVNIKALPALFVWVEGSFSEQRAVGRMSSVKRSNIMHNYATSVVYISKSDGEESSVKDLYKAADFIDRIIEGNQNLNDMMNAGAEFGETMFDDKYVKVNNGIKIVDMYHRKIIYKTTEKIITSTR